MPIHIPPLRERPEDIPLLAHHFAQRVASGLKREITTIEPEAIALLQRYDWPGNVRELQHAVERAVILTSGPVLKASSFDAMRGTGRRTPSAVAALQDEANLRLPSLNIDAAEALLIERALRETGGNKTKAAALLGLTDRTLRNKLARQREGVEKD
jgi:DNA-binding NtrC family response regulator